MHSPTICDNDFKYGPTTRSHVDEIFLRHFLLAKHINFNQISGINFINLIPI